jgi:hypothetical protein
MRVTIKTSLFVILISSLWAQGALSQDFDFKGLVLGSKTTPQNIESHFQLSCDGTSTVGKFCKGKTTFLGMNAYEGVTLDANGVVTKISVIYETTTVWPKTIAAEVSKKFGTPKYQFQNMIFTWINDRNPRQAAHLEHSVFSMQLRPIRAKAPPPNIKRGDM